MPSQQALLLQEGLHEAGRAAGDRFDDAFKAWLAEAESEAPAMLTDLKDGRGANAAEKFTTLEQSCTQCHQKYRDR